ncbi:hypothetical protein GCM10011395_03080 [Sphingomonas psychrolutea]|uniref:Aldehyde dehydrogenase domain-containing protein n=1 Tax=Sphingomonas psychrolutea TaxID=1259676 RepID=A0ABQ1G545_9SPHN|nr:hypothetical protein GCM10011395_03080 [Sphingomonas psychrolutea]
MTADSATSDRADNSFRSVVAETGEPVGAAFATHGPVDVAAACASAEAAFDTYRASDRETRARFLERIGEEIVAIGDDLIVAAMRESGLPRARLEGERGRTVGQLKLFAGVVRSGAWLGLRVDPAMPERQPLPRPDLRLRMIPLGPVAVFGASNFPLAFSTAGGDTASALAAGCPVVVKGHAMVHGGPYPATSDARTTSVGSLAIDRFLRPVSYQNLAQGVLPPELRDAAAQDGVPCLRDGTPSLG